jgi:hypothetical protein
MTDDLIYEAPNAAVSLAFKKPASPADARDDRPFLEVTPRSLRRATPVRISANGSSRPSPTSRH